jgi:hypothetical protein
MSTLMQGHILLEALDSTIANINNGASYTGSMKNVQLFSKIVGTIFADRNLTLYVDFSSDGTNFDYSNSTSVTASTGATFSVEVCAPWVRLRITNASGGNTTILRAYMWAREVS